jgi:hypothetical protein
MAKEKELSPNKVRSQYERLYMGVVRAHFEIMSCFLVYGFLTYIPDHWHIGLCEAYSETSVLERTSTDVDILRGTSI